MCFGGLHLFFKIVNKQLKTENKCRPPKYILALPTWGQKCIFSELQPFELANFDLGHPVPSFFYNFFSQSDGYGHGHHKAGGTACLVKGSYCNCHYCKCEKGTVHCGGYGKGGYGKKYCYGSTQGEYCHCDYCKCKHGYGTSGYGHCDDHHHHHH